MKTEVGDPGQSGETRTRGTDERLLAENHALEQRVEARTRELAAAVRELEAFAYSVSHDLRSPLRAIEGFSDELLRCYGPSLDERGRHYMSRIQDGCRRMAALIDDLLKLSRLTRDTMTLDRCDLSALVLAIGAELSELEPSRRVELVVKPGLEAHGDLRLLRIALENLLRNAWKFTSRVESARVEFGSAVDRGVEAYFVRDNGAGFDMDTSRNLFGVFQRLHSQTEFPGTGVGLATVQRVIRRHGGEAWAQARIGEGATFFFTLPTRLETR